MYAAVNASEYRLSLSRDKTQVRVTPQYSIRDPFQTRMCLVAILTCMDNDGSSRSMRLTALRTHSMDTSSSAASPRRNTSQLSCVRRRDNDSRVHSATKRVAETAEWTRKRMQLRAV